MLMFVLILGIYSFTKNGVTLWNSRNVRRGEWEATMLISCDNNILRTFEEKCACSFGDVEIHLKKKETLRLKWDYKNSGTIIVYVNNEFVYQGGNTSKCFFCIRKNFK